MNWGNLLFSFDGRTGRKGFWIVFAILIVISIIINVVAIAPAIMAAQTAAASGTEMAVPSMPIWIWILMIPLIWISFAVQAKRWHDQDKSAWWILIGFIPFVGGLIVLIMCGFIAGTPGPNRFGDVPAV